MKRVLVLCAALALLLYATGAWSAAPPTATEKKLQRDVAALKIEVKALQTNVKKLKKSVTNAQEIAIGVGLIGACNTVITADGLQGTWQVIDQLSAATQNGKTYFGQQTPVDDTIAGQPLCQAIGVNRSHALPPTIAPFSALLALYQ
jgi:hypothetical protein